MTLIALTATLALTAGIAGDFAQLVGDGFWIVNGQPVRRSGNTYTWSGGFATVEPTMIFGHDIDSMPGVIPGNPWGLAGDAHCGCPSPWQTAPTTLMPRSLVPPRPRLLEPVEPLGRFQPEISSPTWAPQPLWRW